MTRRFWEWLKVWWNGPEPVTHREFDFHDMDVEQALESLTVVVIVWDTSDSSISVDWGGLDIDEAIEVATAGLAQLKRLGAEGV